MELLATEFLLVAIDPCGLRVETFCDLTRCQEVAVRCGTPRSLDAPQAGPRREHSLGEPGCCPCLQSSNLGDVGGQSFCWKTIDGFDRRQVYRDQRRWRVVRRCGVRCNALRCGNGIRRASLPRFRMLAGAGEARHATRAPLSARIGVMPLPLASVEPGRHHWW